jgi:hypothetical protein
MPRDEINNLDTLVETIGIDRFQNLYQLTPANRVGPRER